MTETIKLRYVLRPREVTGLQDAPVLSVYRDYGVIPKKSRDDNFNKTPLDLSRYQEVRPGDLVVNKMKAWQGSLAISTHYGIVSPDYLVCSVADSVVGSYLHYLLRSMALIGEYGKRSKRIRPSQWRLYWEDLAEISVNLPVVEEQRRIADFLAAETTGDELVTSHRRRGIELLKERIQIILDGVVIGDREALAALGIGQFSERSQSVKLAHLCEITPGFSFSSDQFSLDRNDIRLLRGINVGVNKIDWNETVYWSPDHVHGLEKFWLEPGDLVVGMDRPWISSGFRIAVVTKADLPALLLQRVARIRTRNDVTPGYIYWALAASHFRNSVEGELTGVSVPHLSGEQIGDYRIVLPSRENQEKISARLHSAVKVMQAAVEVMERQCRLLEERRRALITAAVTGKLDVTTARGA